MHHRKKIHLPPLYWDRGRYLVLEQMKPKLSALVDTTRCGKKSVLFWFGLTEPLWCGCLQIISFINKVVSVLITPWGESEDEWLALGSSLFLGMLFFIESVIRIQGLGTQTQPGARVHAQTLARSSCLRRQDVCNRSCCSCVHVYLSLLSHNSSQSRPSQLCDSYHPHVLFFIPRGFIVEDHRQGPLLQG